MTFELLDHYHAIAEETVSRLREEHKSERRRGNGTEWRRKMKGFSINAESEFMDLDEEDEIEANTTTTVDDLRRWEEEMQTWSLMREMLKLEHEARLPTRGAPEKIHRYSSERHLWDSFLESDSLALERHTVLKWLKGSAQESGDDINHLVKELQQNAERGDIIAHGWLHTKAAIKQQKRIHAWSQVLDPASSEVQRVHLNSSKTEPLVTQLDPDAPTRQDRKLEAQDEYFERAIWLGCYEMLRRGASAEYIREWCRDRTEIWRAVSILGSPDTESEDQDNALNATQSALWRRMCFKVARSGGSDKYERAVYGILSGDIQTVEPVCRSWDDHLFAHYNALLRSQFETWIHHHHPNRALTDVLQSFGIFDAVQFHGEPEQAGKRLVFKLQGHLALNDETKRPMKMLQGILVAKQFPSFIYNEGLAISKEANAESNSNLIPKLNRNPEHEDATKYISVGDHDSLRVLVHMLIIFKSLGLKHDDAINLMAVENVIVAYISFLRLSGKEELIPLYSSQLSDDRLYATLSRELIDVMDREQRETQIKLMRELGIDVQKFVRFQTRFLLNDFPDEAKDYPAEGGFKLLLDNVQKPEMRRPGEQSKELMQKFIVGTDADRVDRVDMLLIRSLEWHTLVEGLWSETFRTGTILYKRFYSKFDIGMPLLHC
jgi:nuclear pore complex protein Nup107